MARPAFPTEAARPLVETLCALLAARATQAPPPPPKAAEEEHSYEERTLGGKATRVRRSGTRSAHLDHQLIEVLASRNPYRYGTKAYATFQLFRDCGTVGQFRKLVAEAPSLYDAGYLNYSSRDGYIQLI